MDVTEATKKCVPEVIEGGRDLEKRDLQQRFFGLGRLEVTFHLFGLPLRLEFCSRFHTLRKLRTIGS